MSWQVEKLGNICSFVNGDRGKNYPSTSAFVEEGIPFINAGNLSENKIDTKKLNYISRDRFDLLSSGKIRKDDFLFCLRGSLGKFAIVENLTEGAIASSLVIIRGNERITTGYLLEYLRSSLCQNEIEKFGNGAAQPNLSAKDLGEFKIPLPSLNEQKRIAAILDKADSLRRKRQQAIQLADQFLRSVFLDLFGDPVTNPKGWESGSFSDICMINPKSDKYEDDLMVSFVPMTRVSENSSNIDLEEKRTYEEVKKGFTAFIEGDVLFAKITPCMENGKAGIARNLENEVGFGSTEFHVFRPFKPEYAEFIYSLVHLELFRKLSANNFSGAVGHKRVPKDFLEKFPLYLPPFELIKKYSNIFYQVKGVLSRLENAEINYGDLFNSLNQKGFAGQL